MIDADIVKKKVQLYAISPHFFHFIPNTILSEPVTTRVRRN